MKYKCPCCQKETLDARGDYEICPVCFWEDEVYLDIKNNSIDIMGHYDENKEEFLDIVSGANHGLTLRQARENYKKFGACEKSMLPYVKPIY